MTVRILDCVQGSPEWWAARCGIPTGSGLGNIITAKTAKPSASRMKYAAQLIHERITGEQPDQFGSFWMDRGRDMEPDALAFYEFERGVSVTKVGFVTDGRWGVSPDGLIGDEGGLELKCPAPHTHIGYLLSGELPADYIQQVHGCLARTNRQWWDFMSYCPGYRPLLIRVTPNEYTEKLGVTVDAFCHDLARWESIVRGDAAREAA